VVAPQDAAAIRDAKAKQRSGAESDKPPPKLRSLDSVLSALGELGAAENLFKQGGLLPDSGQETPTPARRPKPQQVAPTPPQAPRPAAKAPVDRTPPKTKAPPKPETLSKPPSGAGGSGGLNDLFGAGPSEGRVRIGKRTVPKPTPTED
jgi:hypothetical protein